MHIGPLFVDAYGLCYVVAVIAAVMITVRRWEAKGGDRDLVYEVALWGFPAGVIGGRLYFIVTSWSEVPSHWWGPFAVWDGGLGIWGGIAGGTLAGLWMLRRRGANIPAFMDAAAPALLVAQAIGRVGNCFNQGLFGGPTTLPWALEITGCGQGSHKNRAHAQTDRLAAPRPYFPFIGAIPCLGMAPPTECIPDIVCIAALACEESGSVRPGTCPGARATPNPSATRVMATRRFASSLRAAASRLP